MARHGYLGKYDESSRRDDRDRDWNERNRSFMLAERDRGFFGSINNQARERVAFGGRGNWEPAPRTFCSIQDDYYLNWRDKQIEALDRDYADYCFEREQQFHEDFDAWRRRRRTNPEPFETGMIQTGQPDEVCGTLELTSKEAVGPARGPDPMDAATLGTTTGGR
jgi:hypothetical protein